MLKLLSAIRPKASESVAHVILCQLVPKWVAPNLLTFTGWLCLMGIFGTFSYYDWDYYTTSNDLGIVHPPIPSILWLVFGVLHLLAHTLDGIDGKHARRTRSSTPLGACLCVCVCVCVCVRVCVCGGCGCVLG